MNSDYSIKRSNGLLVVGVVCNRDLLDLTYADNRGYKPLPPTIHRQLRTIVYTQSRKMTELIALWAGNQSSDLASRISAYRAGFLPEERREIEARLSKGELLAVISTSVLELGIDIGDLDLCLLVGYPGSVVSTWQRGGRVGRSGRDSALIQVAGADGLRALQWWQEGRMLEIIEYCRQDVKITRDLYLYGRDNGYLVNLSRLNVPN